MPSPLKKSFAAEQLARQKQQKKSPVTITVIVLVVVIVCGVAAYLVFSQIGKKKEIPPEYAKLISTDLPSIAVLPFVDMSPDQKNQYLGEGIAESILDKLMYIKDLNVKARTSSFQFSSKGYDLKEIQEKLANNEYPGLAG